MIELALDRGYGLSLVPTPWKEGEGPAVRELGPDELGGGRGRGMNGTHRQNGIFIACAQLPTVQAALAPASLADVAPCLACAMGLDFAAGGEGPGSDRVERREYTEEEDAMVAARLRAMGYLE